MNGEVRLGMVLAAAAMAMFATNLDFFALNLSIPGMARELNTSTTNMQWVISGFMLALGSFLIPGGRLGDILGRRRVLIAGTAINSASPSSPTPFPRIGASARSGTSTASRRRPRRWGRSWAAD